MTITSSFLRLAIAITLLSLSPRVLAWTPGTSNPSVVSGFTVDRFNRTDVLSFYNCIYAESENYDTAWTGSIPDCNAGTTSSAFKDDVLRRINFYRAMVGLPADIYFNPTSSSKSQKAALMMSAEGALNHYPGTTWACYTPEGAEAASKSNLALGSYGPGAIDGYMEASGSSNASIGHRRWILYSRAKEMGTGDVPATTGKLASNCLWVIGNFNVAPSPQFIAWPNDGYVPINLVFEKWSLSYPGADFSSASVTMTANGINVPLSIIYRSNGTNSYGDNTIVWQPTGIPSTISSDLTYEVTVSGIGGGGPTTKTYTVTLFDPNDLGETVTISGDSSSPTTGRTYTFNPIKQADAYELQVVSTSSATWVEGAEDTLVSQIEDNTSSLYSLRQTGLVRTGSKAFQLTYPFASNEGFADQSFIITRDILPTSTSHLKFYQRARFTTKTTTLKAEVSTDSGATWTTLWSRRGTGWSSARWDYNWILETLDLSAYAGKVVRLRFIMSHNGANVFVGMGGNYGFFIDDITVTNARHLSNKSTTHLAGGSTSFILNTSTADSVLVPGDSYIMRIRPQVGGRWFAFGAIKEVVTIAPTNYDLWIANNYPSAAEGFSGDHDNDGISNGMEYAFNLNPTIYNSRTDLPQPSLNGGFLSFNYTVPSGITGVNYGAQWSRTLDGDWTDITDSGVGIGEHKFKQSTAGETKLFLRHKITFTP